MVNFYQSTYQTFYQIIILITLLSALLIILNKVLYKILKLKSFSNIRSKNRGLETYEFGTHSIGLVSTISSNQIFILAIVFLLFDIEILFIVPWIVNINLTWTLGNLCMLTFCNFIIYSFILELYLNILL